MSNLDKHIDYDVRFHSSNTKIRVGSTYTGKTEHEESFTGKIVKKENIHIAYDLNGNRQQRRFYYLKKDI